MDIFGHLDEKDQADAPVFKINKNFAKGYAERKRKEELQRAIELGLSDGSSETSSDDDGELNTPAFDSKFINLIENLRQGKVGPVSEPVFKEDDFKVHKKPKKTKPKTYRDVHADNLISDGAEAYNKKIQPLDGDVSDILASIKRKREADSDEELLVKKTTQSLTAKSKKESADTLSTDDFLLDYVRNERWKDENEIILSSASEDFFEEAVDDFEALHNIRVNDHGHADIVRHARRDKAGSTREKDTKRSENRKAKKLRLESQKAERKAEIERLKKVRRDEIQKRIQEVYDISGQTVEKSFFDEDYEPEKFDKLMKKMKPTVDDAELDEKALHKSLNIDEEIAQFKEPDLNKYQDTRNDVEEADEEAEDDGLWFLCDNCGYGIMPGKYRLECQKCEDFVVCQKCFRHPPRHRHPLRKVRVPCRCIVPDAYQEGYEWQGDESVTEEVPDNQWPVEGKATADQDVDDMDSLDCEDFIGELPCRFNYVKLPPRNVKNLSIEAILSKTDQELNQVDSMKKVTAPYHGMKKGSTLGFKWKEADYNRFHYGQDAEDA